MVISLDASRDAKGLNWSNGDPDGVPLVRRLVAVSPRCDPSSSPFNRFPSALGPAWIVARLDAEGSDAVLAALQG